MSELNKIEAKIKKALKKQGTYSPSLDMLITTLAQTSDLQTKAYECALKTNPSIIELSREGNSSSKENPDYKAFEKLVLVATPLYDRLSMTVPTQTIAEHDEVNDLTKAVTKAKKGIK